MILTVDDGHGHTDTDTITANPTDPRRQPGEQHRLRRLSRHQRGNTHPARTAPVPAAVQAGDTLVAFFTAASSTGRTYTGPAGWTLLENKDGDGLPAAGLDQDGDRADAAANAKVKVTVGRRRRQVRPDPGVPTAAPTAPRRSRPRPPRSRLLRRPAHSSPAVTATNGTSWLVTYWADRSSTSTTMDSRRPGDPAGQGSPTPAAATSLGLLARQQRPGRRGCPGSADRHGQRRQLEGASVSILLNSN